MRVNNIIWRSMALFLAVCWCGFGRTLYVVPNHAGESPFTNWIQATSNIQWAADVATNGDTILISNGIYILTNQITVSNSLIISGFDPNDRPVVDGNLSSRVFYFDAGTTGTLADLVIRRGFTNEGGAGAYVRAGVVRDCLFSNNTSSAGDGGGLYSIPVNGSICTILRCDFVTNTANNGGGVYIANSGKTVLDQCGFYANSANVNGGGLKDARSSTTESSVIMHSEFHGNTADANGGGADLFRGIMTYCTLDGNKSEGGVHGGGGLYIQTGDSIVSNCAVRNNTAEMGGGGIFNIGGRIINCEISENTSDGTGNAGGGGVNLTSGRLLDSMISNNTSLGSAGGVLVINGMVRNCLIINNTGVRGGGVRVNPPAVGNTNYVQSCTIAGNSASDASAGGGLHERTDGSCRHYENCIIYSNSAPDTAYYNYCLEGIQSTFSNCCLTPALPPGVTYSVVITNDPCFVASDTGNYRLRAVSPCVNAGVYREWMTNAVDLDGRIRIRYDAVDIGAYELLYRGTMIIGW